MSLLDGWVVIPVLLVALCGGLGLLTDRVFRLEVPRGFLLPLGFASLIVVGGLLTVSDVTAELAGPASMMLALAGFIWNRRPWTASVTRTVLPLLLLAIATFGVFAAPSLLTGQGSIAGYLKLDDSATWVGLVDHVTERGLELHEMPVSSYSVTLETWLGGGYPVGSLLPLGIGAGLVGLDPVAAYQPVIAFYGLIFAVGLAASARGFVGGPWRSALAAFIAVQASAFFGYAQWGGIKEAAAAALLPVLAWLAVSAWRPAGWRPLLALCLPAGAMLGVLGVNGLTWVAPAFLVGIGGTWMTAHKKSEATHNSAGPRPSSLPVAGLVWWAAAGALIGLAGLPALVNLEFARHTTGVLSAETELGNLVAPLPLLQGAGLWPVGNITDVPDQATLVRALSALTLTLSIAAIVIAAIRREKVLSGVLLIAVVGAIPALVIGSPWVDAKVLAIVSPFVLVAAASMAFRWVAAIGIVTLSVGLGLVLMLAAGTVWSTIAVAGEVYVAPHDRLEELRFLGERLDDEGPLIVLDFEPYAERHFLRNADPETAVGLRYRPIRRRDGSLFPTLSTAEVDEVATDELFVYRTIVRRRSPSTSRPPSAYRLIFLGRYWEAWQRPPDAAAPLVRLPLGSSLDPTGLPDCAAIEGLARTPGARIISGVPRSAPYVVALPSHEAPASWRAQELIMPGTPGSMIFDISVDRSTAYNVWVGGSVLGRLEVQIDGRSIGTFLHEIAHGGQWLGFEDIFLEQGSHRITLAYSEPTFAGTGGTAPLGPLALSPVEAEGNVSPVEVAAEDAADLCDGRRYDWIEVLE